MTNCTEKATKRQQVVLEPQWDPQSLECVRYDWRAQHRAQLGPGYDLDTFIEKDLLNQSALEVLNVGGATVADRFIDAPESAECQAARLNECQSTEAAVADAVAKLNATR